MISCKEFMIVAWLLLWNAQLGYSISELGDTPARNWAVLVAGSHGWIDYRHQANVYHAQYLLRKYGIPPEQIITMAFDDLAEHRLNPEKGKVFNDYKHKNYYKRVKIDYRGKDVSAYTLKQVLKGDQYFKKQGFKVLESTGDDNVFFFYSGHGAKGILKLPESTLYADDFNEILKEMHRRKAYKKMLLYIETCNAGALFAKGLPEEYKILAITSSNAGEASYATLCEDKIIVPCLTGEFSLSWMKHSEKKKIKKRTVGDQFNVVKREVKKSTVSKFGDESILEDRLIEFHGQSRKLSGYNSEWTFDRFPNLRLTPRHQGVVVRFDNETRMEQVRLMALKQNRAKLIASVVNQAFGDISRLVERHVQKHASNITYHEQMQCFKSVLGEYETRCFYFRQVPGLSDHVSTLYDYCEAGYSRAILVNAIRLVCG